MFLKKFSVFALFADHISAPFEIFKRTGGDISEALCFSDATGRKFFLKYNFEVEFTNFAKNFKSLFLCLNFLVNFQKGPEDKALFYGEFESLKEMIKIF